MRRDHLAGLAVGEDRGGLHAAYVQASCAGAAVVVFQGMPAVRAVATPRAARVALRN